MGKLFGTDGIRGIANTELSPRLAFNVGRAGAYALTEEVQHKPKVVVGKDTRLSGDMLESAIVAGLCSVGAEVILPGVIPTPGVAYLTRLHNADAGIAISASHNPFEYNGIKFFNGKGYKLSDQIEQKIEKIIEEELDSLPSPTGNGIGRVWQDHDSIRKYVDFLKTTIDGNLQGMKILVDCANGASYECAPLLFNELGAEIKVVGNNVDGININENCGSTHIEKLSTMADDFEYDLGLALDGDADRVLMIDKQGKVVDGDQIMMACALELKRQGKLNGNTLVATVMSNLGLFIACRENGIDVCKAAVGDRYVLEEMMDKDYVLGGEQSGHVIFLQHNTTGDGLITALQVLALMKMNGKTLAELASAMTVLPQVLVNVKVDNNLKERCLNDKTIAEAVAALESDLGGDGRVLLRPSGTEPLIRVMVEGKDLDFINDRANRIADLIRERIQQ